MSFLSPWVLLGLILVPVAAVAYAAHDARRRRAGSAFASAALMPAVAPRRAGLRRHIGPLFYLLALTGLIFAAARPQAKADVKVERASVMLVTDRSGSMLSDDVPGGRMAAAKVAGNTFLSQVPDDVRVGLIAFNQEVQLLATPTIDRPQVREAINALRPAGSTAGGDALARALAVLRPQNAAAGTKPPPAAIILLSDGKSVRGQDPIPVAQAAKKAGVKIYTVALGTDAGVLRTKRADGSIRTQNVPPDRATLQQIAAASGGQAFQAANSASLSKVYEQLGSQVATRRELREVSVRVAGGSLLLLVLGAGASMVLLGRLP